MTADPTETAPQALRELAQWVLRDGIDSDHLEEYMQELLSSHLMELHASCRSEAMKMIRCFSHMTAADLAGRLCESAHQIEQHNLTAEFSSAQNRVCRHRISWAPELIAAIAFTVLGISLMWDQYGDFKLRVLAAGMYGLIAFTHAAVAIHAAWQNAHPASRVAEKRFNHVEP